ncbi:hypothetical protein [Vibrio sp. SCSIO 43137]|uniref:hypothetical protein n=1 Tax=Vibrio sp. SCSIO 43137 TaxID=3021011 RepID=UPI002307C763|nr:hypothetical protein [Vibrio sp. SCSIO 43137]WCE30098.1 hypothetical protein PK654_02030 [Vibrio sp. SCSIO 43137]
MISGIVAGISLVKTFIGMKAEERKEKAITKREELQAKRESNQQREGNISKTEGNLASLDAITLKQIGWLDDFVICSIWLVVWSCFFPSLQAYAMQGMKNLAAMPVWFQYAVGASIIYTLGFKSLVYRLLIKRGF